MGHTKVTDQGRGSDNTKTRWRIVTRPSFFQMRLGCELSMYGGKADTTFCSTVCFRPKADRCCFASRRKVEPEKGLELDQRPLPV